MCYWFFRENSNSLFVHTRPCFARSVKTQTYINLPKRLLETESQLGIAAAKQNKIRRRRLCREIENIKDQIGIGEAELTHTPYNQDKPGIRNHLSSLREDLAQAKKCLDEVETALGMI